MNGKEIFCKALDTYIKSPSYESALNLSQACAAVWQESSPVPDGAHSDVRDAIPSYVEYGQWESKGRTFAGAARRIKPVLKQEYDVP